MTTKQTYTEIWAELLSTNRYLKISLGVMSLVCVGLLILCWRTFDRFDHLAPLVVRIDEVGRAEVVEYDTATYQPDVAKPEVKYFLRHFLVMHRERRQEQVLESWKRSLLFLDRSLAQQSIQEQESDGEIVRFLAGEGQEVSIEINTVQVQPSREAPYRARVDYTAISRENTGQASQRQRWTSELEFHFLTSPPREILTVNPLGLVITYFRSDRISS